MIWRNVCLLIVSQMFLLQAYATPFTNEEKLSGASFLLSKTLARLDLELIPGSIALGPEENIGSGPIVQIGNMASPSSLKAQKVQFKAIDHLGNYYAGTTLLINDVPFDSLVMSVGKSGCHNFRNHITSRDPGNLEGPDTSFNTRVLSLANSADLIGKKSFCSNYNRGPIHLNLKLID